MRNTTYKRRTKYLNILDALHPIQNKTLPIGSVALRCGEGGLDPPNSPSRKYYKRKESLYMKKNIRKVKKFQKPLMCLVVIFAILFGIAVGKFMNTNADEINYEYESNNIDYDNSTSNLNATNVKDAIDELYSKVGQCPIDQFCYTKNMAFVKAYTYDESVCITGDEAGCEETTCYNNGSCPVGTIIDYLVNNTTMVRFHVLHDDVETMTMQSQKNTIYNESWYASDDILKYGPQTIMETLKIVTNNWNNVNLMTMTVNTISFPGVDVLDNLCSPDNVGNVTCSGNRYNIGSIAGTYRARLITIQEATDSNIGQCKARVSDDFLNAKSCRMFMNNFLYDSTNSNNCKNTTLCINDDHHENGVDHNNGYWTYGAHWLMTNGRAWTISNEGNLTYFNTSGKYNGARAVVVVNK